MRIANILQKYHEKPNLLAKASEFIIRQVMDVTKECLHMTTKLKADFIKNPAPAPEQASKEGAAETLRFQDKIREDAKRIFLPPEVHQLLNLIYILIKIRGAEKVKSFFPHEARDFEPVILYLLSAQPGQAELAQPWESNYVMLIWLSLILLMPFDLKILDSDISKHFLRSELTRESAGIVRVIVSICQKFLDSSTRTTTAASVCLGRLFTRSDVKAMNSVVDYID